MTVDGRMMADRMHHQARRPPQNVVQRWPTMGKKGAGRARSGAAHLTAAPSPASHEPNGGRASAVAASRPQPAARWENAPAHKKQAHPWRARKEPGDHGARVSRIIAHQPRSARPRCPCISLGMMLGLRTAEHAANRASPPSHPTLPQAPVVVLAGNAGMPAARVPARAITFSGGDERTRA